MEELKTDYGRNETQTIISMSRSDNK